MNAAVANMGAMMKRAMFKRSAASNTARRVMVAGAAVCAGAMFTVSDAPLTSSTARASAPAVATAAPALQSSDPTAEASRVPGRVPLVVRFTRPMAAASLNGQSVTLVGPIGAERVRVLPLGAMAIIQPANELLPASRYTLFINGATDVDQRPLPLSAIGFDTAAKTAEISGAVPPAIAAAPLPAGGGAPLPAGDPVPVASPTDTRTDADAQLAPLGVAERLAVTQAEATQDLGDWVPGSRQFRGRWRADRAPSPLQALPPLQAPTGTTALSGQVLGMNGRAVPGVTLRVDGREARTDRTGRFLLQGLTPGFAKMEIDGVTANRPDAFYGYYAARIKLLPRQTTAVPYTIWMPRLDPAGTIHIPAPTTTETIVGSPSIPGLELHIPAGTVIRDRQGQIVTHLNLTAIPVDRPPFPVPDLGVPVYFTIQPGGAVLQSVTGKPGPGARLFYPNFKREVPGARGTFWNYDPEEREWFVYGMGTITSDAKQAIPDDGVVIHELTGAMFNGGNTPGPHGPSVCRPGDGSGADVVCGYDGDPVSLSTGQFEHVEHDTLLSDVIPIDITRTYYSADLNQRSFGIGIAHSYDIFLYSQSQWQEVDVILPNGARVHYVRTSPGNDFATAVLECSAPGPWHHSIIARNETRAGWDLFFRDGRRWFFPQFQPMTEIADRNGNVLHIVREDNNGTAGKIVHIVSPNGRSVDFAYNAAGFVSTITDNGGRSYAYNYDSAGQLTEVIDPQGGTRTYTWDASHRITAIHDPNGSLVVQNVYDRFGLFGIDVLVTHQDLADGSGYDYEYVQKPCRDGDVGLPADPCYFVFIFVHVTDRRGVKRIVWFDDFGRVLVDTFAFGLPEERSSFYEHNNDGLLSAIIDPLNRRTEYQYDAAGNVTQFTLMAGTSEAVSWSTTWDATFSRPLTITAPNGNVTTLTYDAKGNPVALQNALGQTWTYTYDEQGRRLTSTDPLGRVTALGYDGADLSTVSDALGRQAQYLTDAVGRVVAAVDPLGNRSVYAYDGLNRLLRSTDPLGGVTAFSYDANGNLLSYTDAKNNTTSLTYNALNKVQSFQDPLHKSGSTLYTPAGQVEQVVDRKGQLGTITYDALGRVITVRLGATEANPAAFKSQIEDTWDVANRLIQVVDKTCADPLSNPNCGSVAAISIITRSYDDFDRMVSEVTPQGEVDYGYDNAGRRTSMTITNGTPGALITQPVVTYTYDNANRLTGIHQAAGSINAGVAQDITLAYDAAGQRTQTTLANGSTINYTHDNAGQVAAIVFSKSNGSLIGDLQYEYDAAGRRTSVGGSLAQQNLPTADVTDATYDANNRLLLWAGMAYTYDDNGNLVGDGASTFQWDERNRLSSILSGPNEIASFQYDSLGRRTGKTNGSVTTGFLYNGMDVVQELEGTTKTAPVKAHLLTGGIDEMFLRLEGNDGANQNSVLSAAHSTIMLLNAAQNRIVGYSYEPYGATTADATDNNRTQYAGRENDNPGDDRGLYYYRARYYMPGIARFISEDPIGWASGQPNNYAYVGGDPINLIDPVGLDANQNTADFLAGFGDLLTLGSGPVLRGWLGIDGVNPNSGWYLGGEILGFAATLAIGTPEAAAPKATAGERALLRGPRCFPAGTMVLMADGGSKPIEQITDGEEVLAKDPASNEAPRSYKVAARLRNYTEHLVRIEVQDDAGHVANFQATREHPVWVKGAGWKNAVDLTAKDVLTDSSGHDVRVLNVQVRAVKSPTFNLTIDSRHTFYVVDNGVSVLVHNTAPEFSGGTVTESQFLDNVLRWVGPGYTEPSPGRFLSPDGLWQARFGAHEVRDVANLHGHFEVYDVPASRGGQVVENMRVSIVPDPCP